jgi:hypothetical protein
MIRHVDELSQDHRTTAEAWLAINRGQSFTRGLLFYRLLELGEQSPPRPWKEILADLGRKRRIPPDGPELQEGRADARHQGSGPGLATKAPGGARGEAGGCDGSEDTRAGGRRKLQP